MVRPGIAFVFAASLLAADSSDPPPVLTCPAGAPLGTIDLRVRTAGNAATLPLQSINRLGEGNTVLYTPVLRGLEKRPGEVTLVMVPAQREAGSDLLLVADPKRADAAQEWNIPRSVALAAFVYGPQGLSKKKVEGFLSQDDQLVAQLADYAEKTSQTEALLQALSDNAASAASMNAALTGFASQYGLSVQFDKNAPPAVQAQTLFATMNPQLATYNPLASSTAQRVGQTASMAAAAATLFFGSPIGLAAGGTAMLLDLRSIAFPGTQFRSSFAQPANGGIHLCGQRGAVPAHTRVAYIWALRIPDAAAPHIKIGPADNVPVGERSLVPVEASDADWKYLQRARAWALEDAKGHKTELKVLKTGGERELEIDLRKAGLTPGDYRLTAYWDWTAFQAAGEIRLRPLSDFSAAKLQPASQNQLLAHAGKVPVTLTGSDFEFTNKVELRKASDEFATAEPLRFILPKGPRLGIQESMDVQIDASALDPGRYELLVTQQDGVRHPIAVNVLPNPPQFDNLPILVNQGVTAQHYVLKGQRLDLLARLEAPEATVDLGKTSTDGRERAVTLHLNSSPPPGTTLPLEASLADRSAALHLPGALEITGPLPVIASSQLSLPAGMEIGLRPNEFPASYTLTAVLDVRNVDARTILHLACKEGAGVRHSVQTGEQTATVSLQQLSSDQLFLSDNTSGFPAGCTLEASLDNGRNGQSPPFALARLIRVPRIASFTAGNGPSPAGMRSFDLTGNNLEMIAKVGWDSTLGVDVPSLPAPIPGMGQRQLLSVDLPEPPSPGAPLFVWLRGETFGRATTAVLGLNSGSDAPNASSKPAPVSANRFAPAIH